MKYEDIILQNKPKKILAFLSKEYDWFEQIPDEIQINAYVNDVKTLRYFKNKYNHISWEIWDNFQDSIIEENDFLFWNKEVDQNFYKCIDKIKNIIIEFESTNEITPWQLSKVLELDLNNKIKIISKWKFWENESIFLWTIAVLSCIFISWFFEFPWLGMLLFVSVCTMLIDSIIPQIQGVQLLNAYQNNIPEEV